MLKDLEDAMQARWCVGATPMNVTIQPFGSFPAGLSTFLSDIDISILSGKTEEEEEEEEDEEEEQSRQQRRRCEVQDQVQEEEGAGVSAVMDTHDDDGTISWAIDRGNSNSNSHSERGTDECAEPPLASTPSSTVASEPTPSSPHSSRRSLSASSRTRTSDGDGGSDWESASDNDDDEEEVCSDVDTDLMNDCGGLDIHINSEQFLGDRRTQSHLDEEGSLSSRKRKRVQRGAKGESKGGLGDSPSREVQLGTVE